MTLDDADSPVRRSRFWLFAPFTVLALAALAWTGAWFFMRSRAVEELDAWTAREAAAGRRWECPDRSVAGFPFRIEIGCARLALQTSELTLTAGRLLAVTQIYRPLHTIVDLEGPLRITDAGVVVDGRWRDLRASFRTAAQALDKPRRLENLSVVIDAPEFRIAGLTPMDIPASARQLEMHVRPDPSRGAAEAAFDMAARAPQLVVPQLNELLGGQEPMDVELQLLVTQVRESAPRSIPELMERWRQAGGILHLALLSIAKGSRLLEAKGDLGLDDLHRVAGRLDIAASGLGDLMDKLTGVRVSGTVGGILGSLLGQSRNPAASAPAQAPAGKAGLTPLPPIRLENGRAFMGPLALPAIRLDPLY